MRTSGIGWELDKYSCKLWWELKSNLHINSYQYPSRATYNITKLTEEGSSTKGPSAGTLNSRLFLLNAPAPVCLGCGNCIA